MHKHNCAHCKKDFICGNPVLTCFRADADCAGCYWTITVPKIIFGLGITSMTVVALIQIFTEIFAQGN